MCDIKNSTVKRIVMVDVQYMTDIVSVYKSGDISRTGTLRILRFSSVCLIKLCHCALPVKDSMSATTDRNIIKSSPQRNFSFCFLFYLYSAAG